MMARNDRIRSCGHRRAASSASDDKHGSRKQNGSGGPIARTTAMTIATLRTGQKGGSGKVSDARERAPVAVPPPPPSHRRPRAAAPAPIDAPRNGIVRREEGDGCDAGIQRLEAPGGVVDGSGLASAPVPPARAGGGGGGVPPSAGKRNTGKPPPLSKRTTTKMKRGRPPPFVIFFSKTGGRCPGSVGAGGRTDATSKNDGATTDRGGEARGSNRGREAGVSRGRADVEPRRVDTHTTPGLRGDGRRR